MYTVAMTKVLVTGANGFVGTHLVKELCDHGIDVVCIGGPAGTTQQSPHITECLSLNLLNREDITKINFRDISGVIHLAGLAAVGPSFDNPMDYITTNIGIETNLFTEALAQDSRPRFLIISTGALYDPAAGLPLTEKTPTLPSSPYAVSKLGQEQMAQYYNLRDIECVIARPFNHIGPGQNLGFIVPDLTKQVVDYERRLTSHISVGNLDAKRDYTDVRDIAKAYRLLLEKGKPGEIYNVCSSRAMSGHEILTAITNEAGVNPPVEQDQTKMRPADNPIIYGDHSKLTADTGWQPEINFSATIKDVVADWRSRS